MAGKEITRLFANDVFRSRNVSHDPPGLIVASNRSKRAGPHADIVWRHPAFEVSRTRWIDSSASMPLFLTRVDEITRVPRSFDMVAPTLWRLVWIENRPTLYTFPPLPPRLHLPGWSTQWRINFARSFYSCNVLISDQPVREWSNSFFAFRSNYDFNSDEFNSSCMRITRGIVDPRLVYRSNCVGIIRVINDKRRYFAITGGIM